MRAVVVAFLMLPFAHVAAGVPYQPVPSDAIVAPLGDSLEDIQATLRLPAATWYNDKDGDKVFDSLERRFLLEPGATQPVIVMFRHGTDVAVAMDKVQAVAGPIDVRHRYDTLGGFNADLGPQQVLAIAALSEVRQVEWSQPGAPELETATYAMGVDAVQDALGIDGDLDGDSMTFTGQDITIGIMDTGFHGGHVDLQGKFLAFIDWTDGGKEKEPYDSGSHGTHVASIAGGTGAGNPAYKGVAPGASFVGFQISGGDTKGNAIASMEWMIENKDRYNIRISTISFGFGTTVDGTDALELATDAAWEAGILPFKSTGNSGNERGTVTIPGGARGILGIANIVDPGHNGFHLSGSSSRGPTADGRAKPDFAAPGTSIMAADAGTTNGYVALSGTSMASPHAAGIAALVLDADPSLTNADVKRIFRDTAHDWGEPGHDIDYGWGRLDALRAVQTALVDRAVHEGWSTAQLEAIQVAPPDNPWHASKVIVGATATDTLVENFFTVETPGQPFAGTFIANGSSMDLAGVAGVRGVLVEVLGPGDEALGTIGLTPITRQQVHAIPTGPVGSYSLRFMNLAGGETMFVDVSAGLPPEALPDLIPEPGAFEEAVQEAARVHGATPPPAQEAPGMGLLLLLGLLAIAVGRRR